MKVSDEVVGAPCLTLWLCCCRLQMCGEFHGRYEAEVVTLAIHVEGVDVSFVGRPSLYSRCADSQLWHQLSRYYSSTKFGSSRGIWPKGRMADQVVQICFPRNQ